MNFNQFLLSKSLSIKQLYKDTGIPRTTITDIVIGKKDIEKLASGTLYKIAKYLNVTMEFLLLLDSSYRINKVTNLPED